MLSVGQTVMCLRRDVYPAGKIRGHLFFARNGRTEVIFDFVKVKVVFIIIVHEVK